jgi:hypothetical protein
MTTDAMLAQLVYAGDGYKAFGDFTQAEVAARADELKAAGGWGPTARVGAVGRAWSELARVMDTAGAGRVADLDADELARLAGRLWVVPPGGSLL